MWGWAGQVVLSVVAVVLLFPARPLLEFRKADRPYLAEARAFAMYPRRGTAAAAAKPPPRRTHHSTVRYASALFVPPAKRTAVIVGINHAAGTTPLPGSVTDATNLRNALLSYGFRSENITMLLESQATRPAILSALDMLAKRTPANGVAVFAIATHTKRSHGTNLLATAEGGRISAAELAERLRAIPSPAWIALPTCYAAGYAYPGIVGYNRVATFASSADRWSYQAGEAGSFLFIHMVRRAMLENRASSSVEAAFAFAHDELAREHPEYVPSISDGYAGDLVLGPKLELPLRRERSSSSDRKSESQASADSSGYPPSDTYWSEPSPAPAEPEQRRSRGRVWACGRFSYHC